MRPKAWEFSFPNRFPHLCSHSSHNALMLNTYLIGGAEFIGRVRQLGHKRAAVQCSNLKNPLGNGILIVSSSGMIHVSTPPVRGTITASFGALSYSSWLFSQQCPMQMKQAMTSRRPEPRHAVMRHKQPYMQIIRVERRSTQDLVLTWSTPGFICLWWFVLVE